MAISTDKILGMGENEFGMASGTMRLADQGTTYEAGAGMSKIHEAGSIEDSRYKASQDVWD